MATPLFAVAEMSPGLQMAVDTDGPPSWLKSTSWVVRKGFWFWHVPWIGFLALMVAAGHRSVVNEAKLLGEGDPPPPPKGTEAPPPCAACRSRRRVPVGWTWWGGVLATFLLGTVRCVDCRSEYSPRTGRPDYRVAFLVLALRLVVVAIALWLVATLLVQVAA
jgi:hypothetical protein